LEHNPDLIYIENANGRTPDEIARSRSLMEITNNPPTISISFYHPPVIESGWMSFLEPEDKEDSDESKEENDAEDTLGTYRYAVECAAKCKSGRKLVSLVDARALAARLQRKSERESRMAEAEEGENKEEKNWLEIFERY
jgi:hypothetical protein